MNFNHNDWKWASETPFANGTFFAGQKEAIKERLDADGVILFRGFDVSSVDQLAAIVGSLFNEAASYKGGNSPRTNMGKNVYTSTEFPADQSISLHNELSYLHKWPTHIAFCCNIAAPRGGATPIANAREILRLLPDTLVSRFRDKGLAYTQKLHGGKGFGKSWQETFETVDQGQVDAFAAENGIAAEWTDDGSLRLRYRRTAIETHPAHGYEVWFNQAEQWHPSLLAPEVRSALDAMLAPDNFPHNVTFGDGSEISDEDCAEIRKTQEHCAMRFEWQPGDLLLLDNVLMAHGRDPFEGDRKIFVSMAW